MTVFILDVVDINPKKSVAAGNASFDFVSYIFSTGGLSANQDHCHAGTIEATIDQFLDGLFPFSLGFLPERRVVESSSGHSIDRATVAHDVHAPKIPLIVKTEKDFSCHCESLPPFKRYARSNSGGLENVLCCLVMDGSVPVVEYHLKLRIPFDWLIR
jgi:hypothetical protein